MADEEALVLAAKALAAWQLTLVSAPTPFDAFRDALERGEEATAAAYPAPALRGLRLFAGEGRCSLCHFGPRLSSPSPRAINSARCAAVCRPASRSRPPRPKLMGGS